MSLPTIAELHPADLFSPSAKKDPYPLYKRLRDEHPLCAVERMGWLAVSRHSDVERVLSSPAEFSSAIMRGADRALLSKDPPEHTAIRKVAARAFDGARTAALKDYVRATAQSLVRGFVQSGGGDFVRGIALELPMRIIAHLLGIEQDRLEEFKNWSNAVIAGASRMIPPGQEALVAQRAQDFDAFFQDLIVRRTQQPGDDLVSALVHSTEASISEEDIRSLAKLLLIAGNETTTNLMANAMLAMLATAGLQQRLRGDPGLCRAWVEETLRYDAPVQIVLRVTRAHCRLAEQPLPPGQVIAAIVGSANRDERQHPNPDAFVLERKEPHLAFGAGPHYCLGGFLARLEATVGLAVLLEESRNIEADENVLEIPPIAAAQLRGPQRLMVAIH